jgi:hypothetical protein
MLANPEVSTGWQDFAGLCVASLRNRRKKYDKTP